MEAARRAARSIRDTTGTKHLLLVLQCFLMVLLLGNNLIEDYSVCMNA